MKRRWDAGSPFAFGVPGLRVPLAACPPVAPTYGKVCYGCFFGPTTGPFLAISDRKATTFAWPRGV
jgi:hypothetical protein